MFSVCSLLDCFLFVLFVVQLLHKLSIHADDGPMKLLKVNEIIEVKI